MNEKLDYIRTLYAPEDLLLLDIKARVARKDFAIHIYPEEGKLLQVLIHLMQAKKIVEIGTHAGYSTVWMARALPAGGILHTIEASEERYRMALATFASFEKRDLVRLYRGLAKEILPTLEYQGPFDLVFIDADKIHYLDYLEWAERNVRSGGLIVADNTLLDGAVYGTLPKDRKIAPTTLKIMKAFNQRLADPSRFKSILLPTASGFTVGIKR